jgi:hypothetical protein
MRESNIWKWPVYSRIILMCVKMGGSEAVSTKNVSEKKKLFWNLKFTNVKTRSISNLKISRPLVSFETSATILRTKLRRISEDGRVLQYRCENPNYRNSKFIREFISLKLLCVRTGTYRCTDIMYVCMYGTGIRLESRLGNELCYCPSVPVVAFGPPT